MKSENIPNGDDIIAKDRHKMMTIPLWTFCPLKIIKKCNKEMLVYTVCLLFTNKDRHITIPDMIWYSEDCILL